jgi:hypothetical protein
MHVPSYDYICVLIQYLQVDQSLEVLLSICNEYPTGKDEVRTYATSVSDLKVLVYLKVLSICNEYPTGKDEVRQHRLKASYTSSLRPHTLSSLRPHTLRARTRCANTGSRPHTLVAEGLIHLVA